ncbi:MAG TPA: UDP-glucose 4-epimerase GalE [Gammaproteobacteria bacterium]|nr:UDP-glucose 4-epimerase GalE [Gammaproteobacteria bacterium]
MTDRKAVLVTGGAGYIGSHVVRQLGEAGERVVILDNLSTGFEDAVLHGDLVVGDTGDQALVSQLLRDYDVGSVLHFAAHTIVPESVSNPLKYYGNNTCSSRNLLACCQDAGVEHIIFSSTAAVYGIPEADIAREDTPTAPINAYGTSKLMTEWMLRDLAFASDLRYVALRYFNVAGSDPETRIGQSTKKATLLIKVACEAAVGKRDKVSIFGTDYPTPDGTGIRDYIHVEDLASAHLKALDYLRQGGESTTLNCGYGHGYSVREVLDAVQRVDGKPLNIIEEARRAGDPPSLVAGVERIHEALDWTPQYDDLDVIVKTSLDWERKLLEKEKDEV